MASGLLAEMGSEIHVVLINGIAPILCNISVGVDGNRVSYNVDLSALKRIEFHYDNERSVGVAKLVADGREVHIDLTNLIVFNNTNDEYVQLCLDALARARPSKA